MYIIEDMNKKNKMYFLRVGIFLSVLLLCVFPAIAETLSNDIGKYYESEKLPYRVSIFPIFNAADADFTFVKDNSVKNGYVARLDARTSGLLKALPFGQVRQVLTSHMILSPDHKRLISRRFENVIYRNGRESRRIISEFDYQKKTSSWTKYKEGKLNSQGTKEFPKEKYYDDPLCAFYNLRFGVYGDFEKGKKMTVSVLPQNKEKTITLNFASQKELNERKRTEKEYAAREYMVIVNASDEVFQNRSGKIEIWFSKDRIPLEASVRGVLYVGNVRGYLQQDKLK